jgi:hypothetical protein
MGFQKEPNPKKENKNKQPENMCNKPQYRTMLINDKDNKIISILAKVGNIQ